MEILAERVWLRKIELSDGQALLEAMDCPKIHQIHGYDYDRQAGVQPVNGEE